MVLLDFSTVVVCGMLIDAFEHAIADACLLIFTHVSSYLIVQDQRFLSFFSHAFFDVCH